jgi:N-acetylmuramoyl-L-alanine amidase
MLDPGHGGIDTGAIGKNGSKEKHVVLAIAKNVRAILRSNGIDARLTRSGDTFIPLYDRVEIAHQHGRICLCRFTLTALPTRLPRVHRCLRCPTAAPVAPWQNTSPTAKTGRMKSPGKSHRQRPPATAGAVRPRADGYHQKQPDARLAHSEED